MNQTWCQTPVIPALGKSWEKDGALEVDLNHLVNSEPVWAIKQNFAHTPASSKSKQSKLTSATILTDKQRKVNKAMSGKGLNDKKAAILSTMELSNSNQGGYNI